MIKKRAKKSKKTAGKEIKKAAKKTTGKRKSSKKERDPKEIRKECSKLIKADATKITAAMIGEGKKGQLGPIKYLFEMASIFPTADDGSQTSAREESLAETLLTRLGIPTSPVVADEYEKESNEVIPVRLTGSEEAEEKGREKVDGKSAAEEPAEVTAAGE